MSILNSERCALCAVEAQDLDIIYRWENDPAVWGVSYTLTPFSRTILSEFIEAQRQGIYASGQLRLIITTTDGESVGMVDLFEFEPHHSRAGVGIFIDKEHRNNGYATEALQLVAEYAKQILRLHQLWCTVGSNNPTSIALFQRAGYSECGRRREWIRGEGESYEDEIMMQNIL